MSGHSLQLTVTGEPSHVGPTGMNRRHDSLAAEPLGRATASWIENVPNARGNVPHITRLHCDVRYTSADAAIEMEALLRASRYP
jgi:hypothetical protein